MPKKKKKKKKILIRKGIKISQSGPSFTILLFADESLLFF